VAPECLLRELRVPSPWGGGGSGQGLGSAPPAPEWPAGLTENGDFFGPSTSARRGSGAHAGAAAGAALLSESTAGELAPPPYPRYAAIAVQIYDGVLFRGGAAASLSPIWLEEKARLHRSVGRVYGHATPFPTAIIAPDCEHVPAMSAEALMPSLYSSGGGSSGNSTQQQQQQPLFLALFSLGRWRRLPQSALWT
jgi:hypothetical protein